MKKFIVIGLILNFLGTIALGGGLILSNTEIDQLSGTYFGSNKFLKENMIENRAWAFIGFILLGLGFTFQLVGVVLPKKLGEIT